MEEIKENKGRRRRGIGISKKTAIGIFVVMIAATLIASGALLSYYGKIETTADVSQAVLVDGQSMPDSGGITEDISGVACNLLLGDNHLLTNNANKKVVVDLVSTETGWPSGGYGGLTTICPEYHLDASVDDDAFYVTLGSSIVWGDFVSTSFDYLIDSDGGNLWIPQMNIVLRDSDGAGQYYASWHSFRTGITGVVDTRTSVEFEKGDFYIYELPSWHLLGLWSDSQWYASYTNTPGDLGLLYRTPAGTNIVKTDVNLYQFDYFTRQAGDTSVDPNPVVAQQMVWLSNFVTDPARTVTGIGLPTPSQGATLQNLWFRMLYDFACNAYEGAYTVETTVDYVGTI